MRHELNENFLGRKAFLKHQWKQYLPTYLPLPHFLRDRAFVTQLSRERKFRPEFNES